MTNQPETILDAIDQIKHLLYQRQSFLQLNQEVPVELEERITSLIAGGEVDRFVSFIKSSEKQIEWLDEEIAHLNLQKKKLDDMIFTIKNLARVFMEKNDIKKIEGERGHSFNLRKNESVHVNDLSKLPSKFVRQKVIIEPDKNAIKAMIRSGEAVEGAEIMENYSVVIK